MGYILTILLTSTITILLLGLLVGASKSDLLNENFRLQQELEIKELELKDKDREIENLHKKYKVDRML